MKFDSICAKEVRDPKTTTPHVLPIYATSAFSFETIDRGIEIFQNIESGHGYSRYANPTVDAVAAKIAALESYGLDQTAAAVMTSSGMSAISTLFLGVLKQGDTVLTQENLYGGTTELFDVLFEPLGISNIKMDLGDLAAVERALQQQPIALVYGETPANPTLACIDLREIARLAHQYGAAVAIDNTFATPYLQQPFLHGADYIIHSTTKYLNGHGNGIAGVILARDAAAMRDKIWKAMKLAGTNCSPFEAWLTHNGMKTLALRMDRHCENALAIAEFLEKHPAVLRVNYPGLSAHPDHALAARQMRAFGGMLSFEVKGGLDAGIAFMNKIQFCTLAPTLGDVDTLILHPASMSHLRVPRDIREKNGITDGLIRLSVGIEAVSDLIADLQQALEG